ncbi:MAG: hypothetical protein ACTSXJ_04160 [Candidatus Baldrarchaeia archaeon]
MSLSIVLIVIIVISAVVIAHIISTNLTLYLFYKRAMKVSKRVIPVINSEIDTVMKKSEVSLSKTVRPFLSDMIMLRYEPYMIFSRKFDESVVLDGKKLHSMFGAPILNKDGKSIGAYFYWKRYLCFTTTHILRAFISLELNGFSVYGAAKDKQKLNEALRVIVTDDVFACIGEVHVTRFKVRERIITTKKTLLRPVAIVDSTNGRRFEISYDFMKIPGIRERHMFRRARILYNEKLVAEMVRHRGYTALVPGKHINLIDNRLLLVALVLMAEHLWNLRSSGFLL